MKGEARVRKLKWLCRRGMKELDVLLEQFLDVHQAALAEGQWLELESLLQAEDDVLWDWLQNPAASSAQPYCELLARIRNDDT